MRPPGPGASRVLGHCHFYQGGFFRETAQALTRELDLKAEGWCHFPAPGVGIPSLERC